MASLYRNLIILGTSVALLAPAAEAKFARDFHGGAKTTAQLKKTPDGFVSYLDNLFQQSYVTPCETRLKDQIYAVARELDQRNQIKAQVEIIVKKPAPKIKAAPKARESIIEEDEDYIYRDYSGFVVRENKAPVGENFWDSENYGWNAILKRVKALKAGDEDDSWDEVERKFGGIIDNDLYRLRFGSGFGYAPKKRTIIEGILKAAAACAGERNCSYPHFKFLESRWLATQPRYAELLEQMGKADVVEKDSENGLNTYLRNLIKEVKLDLPTEFERNESVTIDKEGTIHLPLYAAELRELQAPFTHYIEPMWEKKGLRLKIDWLERNDPLAFLVKLGSGPTGRSSVSFSKRLVTLFSGVRSHSIAHEIGHVLGLPDRYYTVWNPEKCEYSEYYNSADLMSDPETGRVIPSDFARIVKEYSK